MTGAGGYLGGRLVHHLRDTGLDVRALVRRPTPWLRDASVVDLAGLELAATFDGVDTVVHLAGSNEVVSAADPERARIETVAAAAHVAGAAANAGVSRLVYASTVHVYGAAIVGGATLTEDTAAAPRGAYAEARYEVEQLCASAIPNSVILRITNAVGAPADASVQRWTLVANDLCRQVVTTGDVRLMTDGLQWRDFVPLTDVVRALCDAADRRQVDPGIYNVGAGRSTTVRDLAGMVQDAAEELTGRRPALVAPDAPVSLPEPYRVTVDRLVGQGWKPAGPLAPAVEETLALCLAHRDAL